MSVRPRIVVSVGTDHHPFDRLVLWTMRWSQRHADVDVFVQYGTSTPPIGRVQGKSLLPHSELLDLMAGAVAVVTHGGPATVTDARSVGIRPIVVPRRCHFGEHVDDHQLYFSRHLHAFGDAVVVEHQTDFDREITGAVRDPASMRLPPFESDATHAVTRFAELVDELQPRRRPRWLAGRRPA